MKRHIVIKDVQKRGSIPEKLIKMTMKNVKAAVVTKHVVFKEINSIREYVFTVAIEKG